MKKKLLIALGAVVILLAVAFFGITNGLSEGAVVVPAGIDLTDIADGDYTGTYDYKRWTNTVVVHVENHAITGIDIVEDVPAAGITDCSGEVIGRVIAAQNTDVDAVAGATVTSKAYLMAIENALNQ